MKMRDKVLIEAAKDILGLDKDGDAVSRDNLKNKSGTSEDTNMKEILECVRTGNQKLDAISKTVQTMVLKYDMMEKVSSKLDILLDCKETGLQELAYVGEARFGVQIKMSSLERCRLTAKTPEKLALNLVEFVLSDDEIQNCTLYGNRQHKKQPVDERKRFALKSEVFNMYYHRMTNEEKQKEWAKLGVAINDKIRKLRKGKYKSMQE